MSDKSGKKQYRVVRTSQFRKDFRRIHKMGRYDLEKLASVIRILQSGDSLPEKYGDHKLKGRHKGKRECHIEPNWLLVYRKFEDTLVLELLRTGRHSDIFNE